ncbi:alpha/beta fold hydrolase [Streptomyces sp. NPDC000594]|uniref:alpha/beta fold hydrolase n=1 Tax=Streptomyces sp. NPDC000594 TaxID=3154261 RepID=UPI00332A53AE
MPARRRHRGTAPALVLTAGLLAALTAPAHAEPSPAEPDVPAAYTQQKVVWKPCPDDVFADTCATIKVPLDYRAPGDRKIDLALSRIAADPKKRVGSLLLNPGGPAGSGLSMPAALAFNADAAVSDRYDLIGFDPRGVGASTPVTCGTTAAERKGNPNKAVDFARDEKLAKTIADKCRKRSGALLPHITTANTARDLDIVRAVLGDAKLNYLGYSYGTYLGAVYTQLFPKTAGRIVLDSAADPALMWRGTFQGMAKEAERAFTRWTKWAAARHSTYKLGDTAAKVTKTYRDLLAQADRKPVPMGKEKLTGDGIRAKTTFSFATVKTASDQVSRLKKAASSGKPGPALPDFFGESTDNMYGAYYSIVCQDTANWPRDPKTYRKDVTANKATYPLYGDLSSAITPCAYWDKGREPEVKINNKVKVLITQNEWDPQTPLSSARGLNRALKGSVLVHVAGAEGHGAYPSATANNATPCLDQKVTEYLVKGKLPAQNTACKRSGGTKPSTAVSFLPAG